MTLIPLPKRLIRMAKRAKPSDWTVLTKDKVWVRTPRTDPKLAGESVSFKLTLHTSKNSITIKRWWCRLEKWFDPINLDRLIPIFITSKGDYSGPIIRIRPPFSWANREIETFLAERRIQKKREDKILMAF